MFALAQDDWRPQRAYQAAVKNWSIQWKAGVGQGITARELELLCDCFYLPHQHGRRAEEFLNNFQCLLDALPGNGGAIGRAFDRTCSEILGLFEKMAGLKNRDLLFALYRHVWELKEEVVLMREYLSWHRTHPHQTFTSAEHRSKVYRGGLTADLQRLLPMDNEGRFQHRSPGPASDPSDDSRTL